MFLVLASALHDLPQYVEGAQNAITEIFFFYFVMRKIISKYTKVKISSS